MLFPVSQKFLQADIRQRMFSQLLHDTERNRANVGTHQTSFQDVLRATNRSDDDLGAVAVVVKNSADLINTFHADVTDIIQAAHERRNVGGSSFGREQGLQRREDQGQVGFVTFFTQGLGRFEPFFGDRQLDDDLVLVELGQSLCFADHAGGVSGNNFSRNRSIDQGDYLFEYFVKVATTFGDQGWIGGDSVDQSQLIGGGDFFNIRCIDKKFHLSCSLEGGKS